MGSKVAFTLQYSYIYSLDGRQLTIPCPCLTVWFLAPELYDNSNETVLFFVHCGSVAHYTAHMQTNSQLYTCFF